MIALKPRLLAEDCKPVKVEDSNGGTSVKLERVEEAVKLERVEEALPIVEDDAEKLYRRLDVTKMEEFALVEGWCPESIAIKPGSEDKKSVEWFIDDQAPPRKRPRSVPLVLLPTLADIDVRRRTRQANLDEAKEDYKKLKLLKNPEVKKRLNMELLPESVRRRLKPIGMDAQLQYFTLDQVTREAKVTRDFMAKIYGGSTQRTYPDIAPRFFTKHGLKDFMYINSEYQPEAPEIPGAPGLFFCSITHDTTWIRRVIARTRPGIWQYLGQYQMQRAYIPFLSKEEWAAQPQKMRNTWAKVLTLKRWGSEFCARIRGRKELGREPTSEEVEDLLESGRYKLTTPPEVMAALDSGAERLTVWTLKCVGYDNDFQLQLSEKFPVWAEQQRKKKAELADKPARPKGNKDPRGKKRKRADTPESEETNGEDVDDDD